MSKQSYDAVTTPEDEYWMDRGDMLASILEDCDGDVTEAQRRLDAIDAHRLQRATANLATRTLSTPSLETTHSISENTEGK